MFYLFSFSILMIFFNSRLVSQCLLRSELLIRYVYYRHTSFSSLLSRLALYLCFQQFDYDIHQHGLSALQLYESQVCRYLSFVEIFQISVVIPSDTFFCSTFLLLTYIFNCSLSSGVLIRYTPTV